VIFDHLLQTASNPPTDVSALESFISALERAISALEATIRVLANRSVPWEHALPWFTFAVLVGVAMEWWVIRHDFREEMETWAIFHFVGIVRSPSRPSVRKFAVEIASVALIVFGIFGELGIGLEIASINSQLRGKSAELQSKNADLRSRSDQLLALVTQQAGDAKTSAEKARTAASEAEALADSAGMVAREATVEALSALNLARDAKQKTDSVAQSVTTLNASLAGAQTRASKLENSLSPRRFYELSYEDNSTNLDVLKPLAGTQFIVESIPDFEAREAAGTIVSVLEQEGFKVVHACLTEEFMWDGVTVEAYESPVGMDLESMQLERRSAHLAQGLAAFFWANGWLHVDSGWAKRGELDSTTLRIRVGYKPSPFFDLAAFGTETADDINAKLFSEYAQPIAKVNKKIIGLYQFGAAPFPRPDCPTTPCCSPPK
jgi:hypothetical protein